MIWMLRIMTLGVAGYGLFQFANEGGFWPWYLLIIGGGVLFGGSFAKARKPKK